MSTNEDPNIGALTTVFTPPSTDCISSLFYGRESQKSGINLGFPGTSRSTCLPPDFDQAATRYYSPGLCPSGYTYACSYTEDQNTVATCCPNGWSCRENRDNNIALACVSTFPKDTTVTMGSYSINSPIIITAETAMTLPSGASAFGAGPIVRRASTEPTWSTASTSGFTSGSTPSSSSSSSPATATSGDVLTAAAASGSSGLSTGAKAGIGVGVSVGALFVLGCIGALLVRRRRNHRGTPPVPPRSEIHESPKELQGASLQELPGSGLEQRKYPGPTTVR